MVIIAKYASTCPCCSTAIRPGEQVEWSKGAKATHVRCASRATSAPASGYAQRVTSQRAAWGRQRGMGAGHGSAPAVAGYSRYCTANDSCRCYDCAS